MSTEQFFRDTESHAANLEPKELTRVLERLKLAREMIGSIDTLDYFRRWRTSDERLEVGQYQLLYVGWSPIYGLGRVGTCRNFGYKVAGVSFLF